jgi:hypothetical protein
MGAQHHVAAVICWKIIGAKFRDAFYVKKNILQEKNNLSSTKKQAVNFILN